MKKVFKIFVEYDPTTVEDEEELTQQAIDQLTTEMGNGMLTAGADIVTWDVEVAE